ncbi:SH3 domain-containing protein [Puniceibacterium sediminis]|uniref:SH3 domain-containing protein n=1 Tax=Puniceibacterium sediminis TaxID=1608407 RepID=A0A238WIM5_9RHOB|nr:SH3 domain-containing protein [Puniceibacterium sediminis]SNR46173.1 SH3 domain-containing protein [Puniceibacterium sediminis]
MSRYVLLSFAVMGFAFYELSGGADFQPGNHTTAEALRVFRKPVQAPQTMAHADTSVTPRATATRQAKPAAVTKLVARPDINTPGIILASLERPVVARPAIGPIKAREVISSKGSQALGRAGDPAKAVEKKADIRKIDGSRVNLRAGPSTDHSILRKLGKGDRVEVLEDNGNGWLKLRLADSDRVGWIADFLVTASAE